MFLAFSYPALLWKMGSTDCPEKLVPINMRYVNALEKRKSHLQGSGSLTSRLD